MLHLSYQSVLILNKTKDRKYAQIRIFTVFIFITNVDSLDWKDYGADTIIKNVCNHKNLGNGSIILCHNGAKYTAQALDTILMQLKNDGYEVIPVSQLVHKNNYHMNHEGRQISN